MTDSIVPALIAAHAGRLRLAGVTRLLTSATPVGSGPNRTAALAGCYHASLTAGTPFVFGWLRPERAGPITVLTTSPVTGAGLIYPPSASGGLLQPQDAGRLLSGLSEWARVQISVDSLIIAGDQHEPTPLEDILLDAWTEPFGWLLHATPLAISEVKERASAAAEEERDARTRAGSPAYEAAAERARVRHRELRGGESTGAWRVHLLVGAANAPAALTLAGLLSAAIDLAPHGYILTRSAPVSSLDTAISDTAAATVTGTPLLASLAQPPHGEIPGVSIHRRSTFAVTAPSSTGLPLGRILDRSEQPGADLLLPEDSLARHTFVTGATGSGKTTTIQHLLTQANTAGIPWLVIEPTKAEYRHRLDAIVLRIGDLDTPALGINPLQPAPGFPLRTHTDMVKALLVGVFHAAEPFPQIIAAAIEAAYRDTGWNLALNAPITAGLTPRWPTLADLANAAQTIISAAGYGRDVEANVTGFITVRLASLTTGTAATFLNARHALDMDRLLRHNVILELDDIGDDTDKAIVMGVFLMRLAQHLRASHQPSGTPVRHITVIEEAHRLLRRPDQPGASASAVEAFAAMLAEIRAYGEALLIADQIPAKLIPDVIKNTAVKIVHRLPGRDDRDAVGAAINLTDAQADQLVSLPPGTAAIATDGMRSPVLALIPLSEQHTPTVQRPASELSGHTALPTARALALARTLTAAQPAVAVWADLAVLAHLLALPMPTPRQPLLQWLSRQAAQTLHLTLRESVEAAVAARTRAIATTHSPAALAEHITDDLVRFLGTTVACQDPAYQWSIDAFRYNPARFKLIDAIHEASDAPRHRDSDTWEDLLGHPIPGATAAEQLACVDPLSINAEHHLSVDLDHVLYGTPALLPDLTHCDPTDPRWPTLLGRQLGSLHVPGSWVRAYLTRRAPKAL